MAAADSTKRFSNRVEDYARYRPGYPQAILEPLREECGLAPECRIADVGSGTGLLSRVFLDDGETVYGIEPNAEMRAAGERSLRGYPRFHSVAATAEATTLADASVDFVVAGQAFHWFDAPAARREFARILRPDGWAAILWNERLMDTTEFLRAYEALLRKYSTDYREVAAKYPGHREMKDFFAPGELRNRHFPNEQVFDFEGLGGRLLSSSYAPALGHPHHEPMLAELRRIFDVHNQDGLVRFEYATQLYYGRL